MTVIKEEARTVIWEVGSDVDPDTLVKSVLEDLQALARAADGQDIRTDEEIWTQVRERLLQAAYGTRPYCIRCGTCCKKGSPTLRKDDMQIFGKDLVKPSQLITIRKGEMVYSALSGQLEPTASELIKIRESDGDTTCAFFQSWTKDCSIYESRPVQCRAQECWNPDAARNADHAEPLTRQDLLQPVGQLWDVVRHHEERCSHADFSRAMARLAATNGVAVQDVLDLLAYDQHVRDFVGERFNLDAVALEFILGRPLVEFLNQYGLKVDKQTDGSFVLCPVD